MVIVVNYKENQIDKMQRLLRFMVQLNYQFMELGVKVEQFMVYGIINYIAKLRRTTSTYL